MQSLSTCRRDDEIDALVRSGETFGDLLMKCGEGQTFYHEMSERLQGLRTEMGQINAALDDLQPKQATPHPRPASMAAVPAGPNPYRMPGRGKRVT